MLTAWTQRITQREGAVVALEDLADVVEAGVWRVLLVVVQHPLGQDAASTADDAGDAALPLAGARSEGRRGWSDNQRDTGENEALRNTKSSSGTEKAKARKYNLNRRQINRSTDQQIEASYSN